MSGDSPGNSPGNSPGKSLGDAHRYLLGSRIATGGMGEVWRATDTILGRDVAVKLLKNEYADDPAFRSRFEAEARHAAALHHSGVASVFDYGQTPSADGSEAPRPYLVMELVPGEPLSALLRQGEPMPPATASDLVAQAAEAIAAAHAMGIVHRDVKPANLMVTPQGQVKITDFGIARAAGSTALTNTGEVIGTPHYLSPEQAEGKPATEASDIYALGVVLYECLAGQRPFVRETPVATALAHLREPVPPLPDSVPEHLQRVTTKALAKDPGQRFANATELAAALRGAPVAPVAPVAGAAAGAAATQVLGERTQVLASTPPATKKSTRKGLPAWWPLAAAALAIVLLLGAINLFSASNKAGNSDAGNTAADNPSDSADVQQQDPTPQDEQATQEEEPKPTPEPAPEPPEDNRVPVSPSDYLGEDAKQAEEELEDLGFDVKQDKQPAESESDEKDTVASVSPEGLVEPGSTITLGVFEEFEPPDEADEDPGNGAKPDKDKGPGKANGNDEEQP